MKKSLSPLDYPDSELVLGIVAPVGADLTRFEPDLAQRLSFFNSEVNSIRLSKFLKDLDVGIKLKEQPYPDRVNSYMTAGNNAREQAKRGDFLALFAAYQINLKRPEKRNSLPRTVHILRSLKHPEEIRTLRRIYGPGFFLVGVSATEKERLKYLTKDQGCEEKEAEALIRRDEDEDLEFGQKTRDTFQMADVFIPVSGKEQLWRFIDLVFSAPFETPTQDEYGMFLAFAASLRSADLSRQVGAVIMSADGEIIATGANDVPASGGGLYWPGQRDERDWKRGVDENEKRRDELIIEVMKRFFPDNSHKDGELLAQGKRKLAGTSLMNIMEFGRAVHAEMEALLSAARSGISPTGGTLFSTTFPCHNCAKHIVAAGIKRVVYIEPYPKSQALSLHSDSLTLAGKGTKGTKGSKVRFEPFCGVGPRRFFDLFSTGLSSGRKIERKKDGRALKFVQSSAPLRVPMLPTSYIEREKLAAGLAEEQKSLLKTGGRES